MSYFLLKQLLLKKIRSFMRTSFLIKILIVYLHIVQLCKRILQKSFKAGMGRHPMVTPDPPTFLLDTTFKQFENHSWALAD